MKEKEKTLKRKMEQKLKVCLREITSEVDTLMQKTDIYETIENQDKTFGGVTEEHPIEMKIHYPEEMIQPIILGDAL